MLWLTRYEEGTTIHKTSAKRHIYAMILERNSTGSRLKRGVSKAVAEAAKCPRRIVQRIWKESKEGEGITSLKNNRKLNSGRKKLTMEHRGVGRNPTWRENNT
jgi:hypothetical protein